MDKFVISSGHGKYVSGANGIINEVEEARKVVDRTSEYLRQLESTVYTFHDNTSTTQNQNLNTIVNFHNSKKRDIDVSIHFNASKTTVEPMGVEVLYFSESGKKVAESLVTAISKATGLKNRGTKYRDNLRFLKGTDETSILIEICFVDSQADVDIYKSKFDDICKAIAETLSGKKVVAQVNQQVKQPPYQPTQPEQKGVEDKLFNPSSLTLRKSVEYALYRMELEGTLQPKWRQSFLDGQLSLDDALAIVFHAITEGFIHNNYSNK